MYGKTLRRQDQYRTNVLTCREKLGSVDLSHECTDTLKTLGRQDWYHANSEQKNVENGRLINRRMYLHTGKCCEDKTNIIRTMLRRNETLHGKKN